jgi:hypothetical protein
VTTAFLTSLQSHTRCLTCRGPIQAGERCMYLEAVRVDDSKVCSFLCVGCSRAAGVAAIELAHADA